MDMTALPHDVLLGMTLAVRDRLLVSHGMLAGLCEGAAGDLADDLQGIGHDAEIVWGEYAHACPEGHPVTGHCWVRIGDMLADPTRGQFDDGPCVCASDDPAATLYREHYSMAHSEME